MGEGERGRVGEWEGGRERGRERGYVHPHTLPAVAEFVQKISAVEEQHAQQLNNVVKTFRRKTQDTLRKDP